MKRITYKKGEYSQFRLENGHQYFLETLPQELTIKKMVLLFVPTKTLWSYNFPFFIRTAIEPWVTSIELLDIALEALAEIKNEKEFKEVLDPKIEAYVKSNKDKAEILAVQKVGQHAFKAKKKFN